MQLESLCLGCEDIIVRNQYLTVPISAILKHVRVSKHVVVVVVVVIVVVDVVVVVIVVVVVVVGETRCDLRQVEEVKKVETKH